MTTRPFALADPSPSPARTAREDGRPLRLRHDSDQPDRPENRRITIVVLAEPPSLPNDVSFKF